MWGEAERAGPNVCIPALCHSSSGGRYSSRHSPGIATTSWRHHAVVWRRLSNRPQQPTHCKTCPHGTAPGALSVPPSLLPAKYGVPSCKRLLHTSGHGPCTQFSGGGSPQPASTRGPALAFIPCGIKGARLTVRSMSAPYLCQLLIPEDEIQATQRAASTVWGIRSQQ